MYLNGRGVPQDDKEGAKWLRLAAEQGSAVAQSNLGVVYLRNRNVPLNYQEALKWIRMSSDNGDAGAQRNLGNFYETGTAVPQSRVAANALYNVSIVNDSTDGNRNAVIFRTALIKTMRLDELKSAQDLTAEMSKPGNLLKALDQYMKASTVAQ